MWNTGKRLGFSRYLPIYLEISYVGPMTASILTGSLVVEKIFTIGGLGAKFVEALDEQRLSSDHGNYDFPGSTDGNNEPDH